MKKKLCLLCVLLALLLSVSLSAVPTAAAALTADTAAEALHALGLVGGTGKNADGSVNFALGDKLTRAQAFVLVVRFVGAEKDATANVQKHPFTDVPAWANPYIGYVYANGITKGVSETKFDPDTEVSEAAFLTILLRVLGYDDGAGDFKWNDPYTLAKSVGLCDAKSSDFNRGGAFVLCYRALTAAVKSGDSIAKRLIAAGVFTESAWNEVKDMMTDTPTDTPAAPENPETKITPIAELNRGGTDGDHMDDDYNTATVEADFRTKVLLNAAKTGSFRYDNAFYPRVKKVRDDLYLLLYHFTQTGQHLYYATSRDGVHWNAPEVLYNRVDHNFVYESGERAGQTDGYYAVNPDAVVLSNGEILCAYSVRPFNGYETYTDLSGIDLIRGRATEDGKIEWSDPTRIYTGQNWEASFLKHDDGRIELYFTQIAPYISKYGYDKSYRSSGTAMLVSTDNGYTWTPHIQPGDRNNYRATTVFQQSVGTRNDLPYFCGQMPVAISLANGKTMLAVEIRRLLQQSYDVSYALSGEGGVWRALDFTEEGPDTTRANYIAGAASPYLARFDSGEVVMTYAAGNRLLSRLGAPDGSAFSGTSFSILPDAPGFWGSVERVGSHAMLFVNQATSSDGATGGIAMIRGYLNHRINAPKYTVRVDGYTNDWENNTDAFFVGSETQAQVTLRTAHDDENLYFLISRLDEFVTDRDTATVCIAAGAAADYRITVGLDGIRGIEYYQNGAKQETLTGGTAAVRVLGTPNNNEDKDEGFVVEFSIPKALVGMTGKKSFKARLALVNGDGKGETADSMSVSLYSTAKWPAVVLDDFDSRQS